MPIGKIFTASDQIMPMHQAHIVREEEEEEDEECEEEEDGTLITMDTTLGLDETVSHFIHIIFKTIDNSVCVCVYARERDMQEYRSLLSGI